VIHSGSRRKRLKPNARWGIGVVSVVTVALVVACDNSPTRELCSTEAPTTVEATTFAPSLNVDVSKLTVNNAGVYFEDRVVGMGAAVEAGDIAVVAYTGWLSNGTQFDTSQQFRFVVGLGQVIIGWDRGVEGIQVGGTRLLVIPPPVGYGLCPVGPIPGNSVLVFEVMLTGIE